MANKNTITDYFKLLLEILVKCDIVKLESSSGVMHESMKQERVYLADKKRMGCSVQTYKSLDAMEQRMFIWEKQMMKAIWLLLNQAKLQGGWIKCTRGVFLGHFLITIKWTWGFFPKVCNLTPPLQLDKKDIRYLWKWWSKKALVILEKLFPLVGEGESNHIPQEILLCKTSKVSKKREVFLVAWKWCNST